MIFLTAFTQNIIVKEYQHKRRRNQFYEEYKWLLRSINKIYPEATAVLYNFEGVINIDELKKIHKRIIAFNWNENFKENLGIDLNYLRALIATFDLFKNQDVIMIDPDCIIVKRFDEYIFDETVDITAVTRGHIKWNGHRNDIIFAPAIYHSKRISAVKEYVNHLYLEGYKMGEKTGDWWSNVQPCVTKIYLEAGINLDVDFETFASKCGTINISDEEIKLKVVPQYVLSYPIQDEKYYPETAIIHYKNHGNRKQPELIYKEWMERKS